MKKVFLTSVLIDGLLFFVVVYLLSSMGVTLNEHPVKVVLVLLAMAFMQVNNFAAGLTNGILSIGVREDD